ncbi:MAG: long-chain-fatty-acid--CoA ligase [Acidimicrobiaceae bacterium]|nr:long-chain-fatty-acid--CoA ligase [Acidimicrobiaceae bacterium]
MPSFSATADVVRDWAARDPDRPALRFEGRTLTYRQLDERSSRVARALRAAGVGPGRRVAFLDKNGPEQAELFFGAAKINAVPTPVNYRLAGPEIGYIVADTEAPVFVVGEEFVPAVEKVAGELPGVELVVIGASDTRPSFEAWRDAHPAEDPQEPQAPDDVAYQLYSSGTTGRPKGVQLTNANLFAGLPIYSWMLGMGPDSVSLVAMPLYHIGGGGWLLAGLCAGGLNVIAREAVPARLVETIEQERVTQAFLVPAVLQFMLAEPGVEERDFSALHAILYGASPISEQVLKASMRTFGCQFVQAYGLTETTGTVVYLPAADHDPDGPHPQRLRACGIPTPGTDVRVVDAATGDDLRPGEVGEIWIKGPTIMHGYWHLPEATEEAMAPGGWFRSGDAGYLDADGYLYIYDRVKDMIVSAGENIYPAEIENVLMSHPAVADVAVIGVPHERWGESPKAIVVRAAGAEVTDAALIAWCREQLAGFKCPTSVDWVEALPRNPSGKIMKKELRLPYWEGKTRMVG